MTVLLLFAICPDHLTKASDSESVDDGPQNTTSSCTRHPEEVEGAGTIGNTHILSTSGEEIRCGNALGLR